MSPEHLLKSTPWDSAVYGVATFEVEDISEEVLSHAARTPGHYTAKVDPLSSKRLLQKFGFYYCDTLVEPHCAARDMVRFVRPDVRVSQDAAFERVLAICHGAFEYDRFHRDIHLAPEQADLRYDRWLAQLHERGEIYGLFAGDALAGFIGLSGHRLVLHAVAAEFRGQGLAKYLWSAACSHFVDALGLPELESSISAANLPVLNLYASLGFRFRRATDVYHLLVAGEHG